MNKIFSSISPKSCLDIDAQSNKENIFIPFINERDGMGRLLTKARKQYLKEASLGSKPSFPKKNYMLTQMFQDSKNESQNFTAHINLQDSIINYDRKAWKARTFTPEVKDPQKFALKPINRKITQSELQSFVSQKRVLESPRLSISSVEGAPFSKKSSLVFLNTPKSQAEIKPETTPKSKVKMGKSLPKLVLPSARQTPQQICPTQEDEDLEKIETTHRLNDVAFRRCSAMKLIQGKSYFRNIKTQDDQGVYMESQQAFHKKIVLMKDRLNTLRSRIGEIMD